jgi:hypothetical protein
MVARTVAHKFRPGVLRLAEFGALKPKPIVGDRLTGQVRRKTYDDSQGTGASGPAHPFGQINWSLPALFCAGRRRSHIRSQCRA